MIEIIDWTLKKSKDSLLENNQQNEEQVVGNIIEEFDNKRDITINKKKIY
jgi:hypothetical protein